MDKVLNSLNELIKLVGVDNFLPILFIIILVSTGRRLYIDYRKDREMNMALKEKERTIQRVAKEAREWKILYFKEVKNWDDDRIEKFFIRNEFVDGIEARETMERRGDSDE